MRRHAIWLALAGVLGCQRASTPEGDQCFRSLERTAPGRYLLSQPMSCTEAAPRYRVTGDPTRPTRIEYLGATDEPQLTYAVSYHPAGQPSQEERILKTDAPVYRRIEHGDSAPDARPPAPGAKQTVRYLTILDGAGNAVIVEKYAGAALEYRWQREFEAGVLRAQTLTDDRGRVKLRSRFERRGERFFERMTDGAGRVLLERELDRPPAANVDLDTGAPAEVQD